MTFKKNQKVPLRSPGAVRRGSLRIARLFMRGYKSPRAVAAYAGVSVRTVYRFLEDARSVGFIVKERGGCFCVAV